MDSASQELPQKQNAQNNRSVRRKLRVRTEDSAYVYCVFEAHEGVTSYSTLEFKPGDAYRDLELRIPLEQEPELDQIIKILGDLVYEIGTRELRP